VSSLKVICPKCFKGQQIVVDIPLGGLDYVCLFCKTTFRVRPPARPSSDELPAVRGVASKSADLPAARETMPRPSDLPVPREAIPRPGDLPVDRATVPRPGDLPVSKAPSLGPNLPVSSSERVPSKTAPLGLALELSFSDVQKAPSTSESSTLGDPLADSFDLGFLPPPPASPQAAPPMKVPATKLSHAPDSRMPPPLPHSSTRPQSPLIELEPPLAARPILKPLVPTPAEPSDSGLLRWQRGTPGACEVSVAQEARLGSEIPPSIR
jgi:hypothetical protein